MPRKKGQVSHALGFQSGGTEGASYIFKPLLIVGTRPKAVIFCFGVFLMTFLGKRILHHRSW